MRMWRRSSTRASRRPRRGFTLIELLVVIAIIMLLAAIALPVLNKAARQARAVKCVGNLKQLAVATVAYAGANDGRLPNAYVTLTELSLGASWPTWLQRKKRVMDGTPEGGQIWAFYRDAPLIVCPSDSEGNHVFSYSMPVMVGHRMIEQADNTSESILILGEHEKYHLATTSIEGGFGSIDRPAVRHGRRTPVGYFDGRAALVEFPGGYEAYDVEIPPWGYNDRFPP